MTTQAAIDWFVTQPVVSLINPLSRDYLAQLLDDPVTAEAALREYFVFRTATAIEVAAIETVTTEFTDILARIRVNWSSDVELFYINQIVDALSILPFTANFSTLPDGALPAPFAGATWTIASGKAINTPTETGGGANRLTDGGYENWSSSTNLISWTETLAGTSTVNQETVEQRTGIACARYDVDASNSLVTATQIPASIAIGDWVRAHVWLKNSTTGKSVNLRLNNGLNEDNAHTLTTSYAEYLASTLLRVTAGFNFGVRQSSAASSSIYCDDASFKILTTSTVFATIDAEQSDVTVKANWTIVSGAFAGIVMNLDSASAPLNYVALVSGNEQGQLFLWKVINGVPSTTVLLGSITYVANAAIELRKSGTTYRVFYNGAQVGANQTISDATIISNTRHGLASVYADNQCSFFSAA